jgi:hypothetical protein
MFHRHLHGDLLSGHKRGQAYPGAPEDAEDAEKNRKARENL